LPFGAVLGDTFEVGAALLEGGSSGVAVLLGGDELV